MMKQVKIVIIILVCCLIETFDALYKVSWVNLHTIQRDLNTSIIKRTTYSSSVVHCSAVCVDAASQSFYFNTDGNTCYCNSALDDRRDNDTTKPAIKYGLLTTRMFVYKESGYIRHEIHPARQDCLSLYQEGFTLDGVYNIQPTGGTTVYAWCDMSAGGWTVFQRRTSGEEDFNRNWNYYKFGFGNPAREFWLGLESIHHLTQPQASELSIELETFGDKTPVSSRSVYTNFSVTDETDNYRLLLDGFSGDNCGDHLNASDKRSSSYNMPFTTRDVDNDKDTRNCAVVYHSGWWHNRCYAANFNGVYRQKGVTFPFADAIVSANCWGYRYSLKMTVMKQKRVFTP